MKKKIKTALISVSDKSKLDIILKTLNRFKVKIISSGGTYKKIKNLGYGCVEISDFTDFPEILDGRVKTLNPKIHAGILNMRNKSHNKIMNKFKFENIDLVIVNFYPFEKMLKYSSNHKKILDNIDIGGPTLVRSAAKNYENVTIISSTKRYGELVNELIKNKGSTTINFRKKNSEEAFLNTSYYDASILRYFSKDTFIGLPDKKVIAYKKYEDLRYGENPHQIGAVYHTNSDLDIKQISGKKLSYNNYNDLYYALLVSKSMPRNRGTVIVKHANPCGISIHSNKIKSYKMALKCDPVSAYGGIVSCNFKVSKSLATELNKFFLEIIVANGFDKQAINILKRKKNLVIIDSSQLRLKNVLDLKSNFNSLLIQNNDIKPLSKKNFMVVSKVKPSKEIFENLIFAFNACKFVKSNAIVISKDFSTIGIGSGQSSRIDSCDIAINKMRKFYGEINNSKIYAASDAFFPFVDGIEKLVQAGVTAIIQPYGSIRDREIIKFANKAGIVLIFSKTRHFKH